MKYKLLRYNQLYEEIRKCKASKILEVGTYNGDRAVHIMFAAKENSDSVYYIGFDLFEDVTEEIRQKEFHSKKHNLSLDEVKDKLSPLCNVELIKGNTRETLPKWANNNKSTVDFAFIDGGHSEETIKSDWEAVSVAMKSGSVVILDDYYHNMNGVGCKKLVSELEKQYDVEILPIIDVTKTGLQISLVKVLMPN